MKKLDCETLTESASAPGKKTDTRLRVVRIWRKRPGRRILTLGLVKHKGKFDDVVVKQSLDPDLFEFRLRKAAERANPKKRRWFRRKKS